METIQLSKILAGHEVPDELGEGDVVMAASVMMKVIGAEGKMRWMLLHTAGISEVELIGCLSTQLDKAKRDFLGGWQEEDDG